MILIITFTDMSVEAFEDIKRVSIDYPLCIVDFGMDTQKTYQMDTAKRQVSNVSLEGDSIWNIYNCPFEINSQGVMVNGIKPIEKKIQWVKKI